MSASSDALPDALRFSMYMIALGMGGIKPCVSSFGADQFDASNPEEEAGRGSFFNWFYGAINVGSLIGTIAIVYVLESIGWGIGYAICAGAFAGALLIFVLGWGWYKKVCGEVLRCNLRHVTPRCSPPRPRRVRNPICHPHLPVQLPPSGSPLSRIARTVYAAWLKRRMDLPQDAGRLNEVDGPDSAIPNCCKLPHSKVGNGDQRCGSMVWILVWIYGLGDDGMGVRMDSIGVEGDR